MRQGIRHRVVFATDKQDVLGEQLLLSELSAREISLHIKVDKCLVVSVDIYGGAH